MARMAEPRILTDDAQRLVGNFFSLSVLQGVNYLLPLITLPYLVRVLGPEKFGLIAFAQAFIQYFVIFTDYGFNLSATKQISLHRKSKQKLLEIFSSVMLIKLSLSILGLIILCTIVFGLSRFKSDWRLYFLAYGIVIGRVLFPTWFFQGMEKMQYIAFLNVLAKAIFTIAIFVFIKRSSDYIYVPLINSVGALVSALLALITVKRNFGISLKGSSLGAGALFTHFKEGFFVFSSLVFSTILYVSPTVFIGIFLSYSTVGFYTMAEKIVSALKGMISVFNQTVYPWLSKLYSEKRVQYFRAWQKCAGASMALSVLLFLPLFFLGEKLIETLFAENYQYSVNILRFLSVSLILYAIINLLGLLGMLVIGYSKHLAYSQIGPISLFMVLSPLVLRYCSLSTYIVFFLLTESGIIVCRLYFLHRKGFLREALVPQANG